MVGNHPHIYIRVQKGGGEVLFTRLRRAGGQLLDDWWCCKKISFFVLASNCLRRLLEFPRRIRCRHLWLLTKVTAVIARKLQRKKTVFSSDVTTVIARVKSHLLPTVLGSERPKPHSSAKPNPIFTTEKRG